MLSWKHTSGPGVNWRSDQKRDLRIKAWCKYGTCSRLCWLFYFLARLIMLSRQPVFKLLLWRAKRLNLQHHQLCIHYIQAGVAEGYVYSFAVLSSSSLLYEFCRKVQWSTSLTAIDCRLPDFKDQMALMSQMFDIAFPLHCIHYCAGSSAMSNCVSFQIYF